MEKLQATVQELHRYLLQPGAGCASGGPASQGWLRCLAAIILEL
jgi:hypothetical protein